MTVEECQNLIIGSGEAGKYLAWTLASQGQEVILVERAMLGGSCPNVACLPSKNLIHSARVTSLVRRAAEFGIEIGPLRVDFARVVQRKRDMVDSLLHVHEERFAASGARVLMGEAHFIAPRTVRVAANDGVRMLRGARVFLSVGSRASQPDVPGLAEARPLTHVGLMELERLPEHLLILGGGYVGVEFAQAMRRFGSQVTLVDWGGQLLGREDADVAGAVLQLLRDEGVTVLLNADPLEVVGCSGQSVRARVRAGAGEETVEASDILIAAGRTPNTDGLGLETAGVALDPHGYVAVNDRLETTAPDVWAMGDCAGSPQFTHAAYDDFRVVRDNLAGGGRSTRGRLIPYCLFTDPEVAHVGLTERQATENSIPYRLLKVPMAAVLRTRTTSEPRGFLKALIGEGGLILGFTAFGAEASEMLAAVQTAMWSGMTCTDLRDAIFAHPTAAEGLNVLFAQTPPARDERNL